VAAADGTVFDGQGWTSLVVTPERGLRAIDGLLTGWHESDPHTSPCSRPRPVASSSSVPTAALEPGYLWHEFGDLHLILP
jgi:S-adenosylmethionine:tRNA ribosyltransferase-isomerase